MSSVSFGGSVSAHELTYKVAEGCLNMCGMCPSCAFAPKPPGTTQCLWKVSDEFKRRFLVELVLRCRNTQVLESVQSVLGVTSWGVFTYARSRSPVLPEDFPCRSHITDPALEGKPLGVDMAAIWDWFNSSPDWMKSRYLCRLFSMCYPELLRMVANLTNVLLVRQKRGFLQFNVSGRDKGRCDGEVDSEDPALMVVPGSSKSVSGVSRYRDFISCLPVDLAKRILGLLDEETLKRSLKVCRYWQHLAQETMEDVKFRKVFQDQIKTMMKRFRGINLTSSTYANIVEVPVPVEDNEKVDISPSIHKVKPFKEAYAKIKTKMVKMEERNVFCGAFFTKVLLSKEDHQRVVDYRGGSLMAMGSKDRVVYLFYVASGTELVSVLKGHVGSIRAVLLYEERDMLITASCDASIRCWDVTTDRCVMMLYGHTGTVNCLDVLGDRLVSGARDCLVKVWSLQTGKQLEEFIFKHSSPVQCVKISTKAIYSSSDRGFIKIWDIKNASLLRVIDAHKSSVKCLFFDEWHFLSADLSGQVMAWSINCKAKECLMTYNHPKEVKSLTLVYLRVITGCADGKIRIFDFLTGDCLREITAETEFGRIQSMHFHENSLLVNSTSSVKRYQFAKVFWDYAESTEGGQGDVVAHDGLVSKKSPAPLNQLAKIASPTPKKCGTPSSRQGDRNHALNRACIFGEETGKAFTKQSVRISEKAASARIKKRGLHHPPTRDSILLRVNTMQKVQCTDELSINMECNARLRDSWAPRTPHDPQTTPQWHTHDDLTRRLKTCVPLLNRAANQNMTNAIKGRDISTAPAHMRRRPSVLPKNPPSAMRRASSFTAFTTEGLQCLRITRPQSAPEHPKQLCTKLPRISSLGPFRKDSQ